MTELLQGQIALVTGGSRGIGAAIAALFAAEGASVAVNYRADRETAGKVVEAIAKAGGTATAHQADIADEQEVHRMVDAVLQRYGRIDSVVCNAGIVRDNLAASMPVEDYDQVLRVNLRGPFLVIREVLPSMIQARLGSIVNLSSVRADSGGRGQCNYAVSKAGVQALTRSLALELAPRNIRVNAIAPGLIETEMTQAIREMAPEDLSRGIPMRRYGQPIDVAHAAAFLCSSRAAYITGTILSVAGGLGL
ncbi:MAG: SDR family oxidoreductase [Terracidiphilus sp.]